MIREKLWTTIPRGCGVKTLTTAERMVCGRYYIPCVSRNALTSQYPNYDIGFHNIF